MTITELIEELKKYDGNLIPILLDNCGDNVELHRIELINYKKGHGCLDIIVNPKDKNRKLGVKLYAEWD